MTTLATLRTQLRSRLDESTAQAWTDAELLVWLNEGAIDLCQRAECLQTTTTIAAVIGQQAYALPSNVIRVYRVEWQPTGGGIYALEYRDFHSMDEEWWTQQAMTSGTPHLFTMWGYPGSASLSLVAYPKPSAAGNFKVFYYKLPTAMAADGDSIDLPTGWDRAVLDYAEYMAQRRDGQPTWQEAKGLYEQNVQQLIDLSRRWSDQGGSWGVDVPMGLPGWLIGTDW